MLNRTTTSTTTTTTTTTITTMTGRDLTCALLLENRPQVIAFVDGLFVNCQDLTAFKVHLRDFLVQTKVRHHDRQPFSLSLSCAPADPAAMLAWCRSLERTTLSCISRSESESNELNNNEGSRFPAWSSPAFAIKRPPWIRVVGSG